MSPVLAFSFPNPFDLICVICGALFDLGAGQIVSGAVSTVIAGLAQAVVGALVDLTASVLAFFWDAAEPELTSGWFSGPDAPYSQMVLMAMPLLVVFVLVGIIQGVMRGDTAGMLRMVALRLPGSVLAMSIAIAVTDLLLDVTDDLSRSMLEEFRDDVDQVAVILGTVAVRGGGPGQFLVLVFALVGLLAAVLLVVELFVRAGLLYLVAAFSPLIFAAGVWEPMRAGVRKLAETAMALIVSKLAIAVALAVSAAALAATWPGTSQATEMTTPEQAAAQLDQSVAQTVGILVGAIVMFCVAAFMPFVLMRLLPVAEGAMVAQGIKGGPFRAAYMGHHGASMALHNPATSMLRSKGGGSGVAGGGAGGAAASAAHLAAAAAMAGAKVAKKGVDTVKDKATQAAGHQSSSPGSTSEPPTGGGSGRGGPAGRGGQAADGSSRSGAASSSGRSGSGRTQGSHSARPDPSGKSSS
ncbi:MAG: hypothetical protein ACRD2C_20545 [Acidimicrobiales bacterium]